ncbi:DUF3857 domain-containing transglutaminase family protein [Myxococcota bacterium]|nr:DUF3857 domain-containing transglutaminase family protein [Myxococcota bacterium]MBU1535925.1 DUF3857 domain-containing transglutaminase family protein [Myxococcota bacterium]
MNSLLLSLLYFPFLISGSLTSSQFQGAVKKADAVIDSHRLTVTVAVSGASTTLEKKVYRVMTVTGAAALTTHRFDVDPATNRVDILSATRITLSGKRSLLPLKIVDAPQPAGWILWRFRMKILTLPALAVGERLELVTRKKGFLIAYLKDDASFVPPMKGHFYDQVLFGDEPYPVKTKRYILRIPASMRLQTGEYNGPIASSITYGKKHTQYIWSVSRLGALKHEPRMPFPSNSLPKVLVATVPDWAAKSRWFYSVNKAQFATTPAISKKVKALLRGAKTRKEKVARLTRWVANNIRYRGFSSYGSKEGYTLHSGDLVFRQRAGVCKDIASMLVTMLRAAGFEVYPAMTMAGARVENIPADQFNHSVVALREKDGSFTMLDPTWAPYSRYNWSWAERGQHYVVGTPRGDRLRMIPHSKPTDNMLNIKAVSRLSGTALRTTVQLGGAGYKETALRRLVGGTAQGERGRIPQPLLKRLSAGSSISGFAHADPLVFTKPMTIRFSATDPMGIIPAQGGLFFTPMTLKLLPDLGALMGFLHCSKSKKRSHPLLLRSNQKIVIDETMNFGSALTSLLPTNKTVTSHAASLEWGFTVVKSTLRFHLELTIVRREISPSHYGGYKKVIDALEKLRRQLHFVSYKGGKR